MSYIIDKWNDNEVVVRDNVCGWFFEKGFNGTPEHRPLMDDAMIELFIAGLVTSDMVSATSNANEKHQMETIAEYLAEEYLSNG